MGEEIRLRGFAPFVDGHSLVIHDREMTATCECGKWSIDVSAEMSAISAQKEVSAGFTQHVREATCLHSSQRNDGPSRKAIKRWRYLAKRMRAAFMDPALHAEWWQQVTSAQQRMIDRRDPEAFDLLAIAKESLNRDVPTTPTVPV